MNDMTDIKMTDILHLYLNNAQNHLSDLIVYSKEFNLLQFVIDRNG